MPVGQQQPAMMAFSGTCLVRRADIFQLFMSPGPTPWQITSWNARLTSVIERRTD